MAGSILIVEDDPIIRGLLTEYLEGLGRQVHAVEDGSSALAFFRQTPVSIVLLDIQLPDSDGLLLLQEFKRINPQSAVIMVTSRRELIDRVLGLEMGADDYLPKPFELRELAARIKALERRDQVLLGTDTQQRWIAGHCFDLLNRSLVSPDGYNAPLTEGEFRILHELSRVAGQPVRRDRLQALLSKDGLPAASRTLDVVIARLRSKFGDDGERRIILTVHGIGYRLAVE